MRSAVALLLLPAALAVALSGCASAGSDSDSGSDRGADRDSDSWISALKARIEQLDDQTEGELGVHVRRIDGAGSMSHQASRPWYLSSTIKVPVAIVVLKQVEDGRISLDQELTLQASDYVDGAGELQGRAPGTKLRVSELLEKSLVQSDSTATDMLIRLAGEDELNSLLRKRGFGRATTLAQVRPDAYAELHPKARELTNLDYLEIKRAGGPDARMRAFAAKVGVEPGELRASSLEEAFERYYEKGLNSASLDDYADLLEDLAEGKLLSREHSGIVLKHMRAMTTGERRLKAGLPGGTDFAQKTGTQVGRVCNMGIIEPDEPHAVVVTACAEKFGDQPAAEELLARVGRAIAESGALSPPSGRLPPSRP